jgi:hypothetical protein
MESEHCYIAIDMKSFYASVECVARGYDPLTTNLLVADESRSDQTICLAAVSLPGPACLKQSKLSKSMRGNIEQRCITSQLFHAWRNMSGSAP